MDKHNTNSNLENISHNIDPNQSPEELRRAFLKRFGKFAATAPVVTYTLISAKTSKAISSGTDEGG